MRHCIETSRHRPVTDFRIFASIAATAVVMACSSSAASSDQTAAAARSTDSAATQLALQNDTVFGPVTSASASSMGKVPVLMVHVVADHDAAWTVTKARFQQTQWFLTASVQSSGNSMELTNNRSKACIVVIRQDASQFVDNDLQRFLCEGPEA